MLCVYVYRCWTCNGFGRIECSVCSAKCQLKWYIKLTVTWKTHKADHIVERTALPDDLIRAAEGKVAFQDQQPRVSLSIGIAYYYASRHSCSRNTVKLRLCVLLWWDHGGQLEVLAGFVGSAVTVQLLQCDKK